MARNSELENFFAQRRGGSNVYGGPPQRQAPAPRPYVGSDGAGQGRGQQSAAQLALTGGNPVGQPKQSGGGGGISLGNIVGNSVGALGKGVSMGLKGVVNFQEEFAKAVPDFLEVAQPLSMLVDEDKSREDDRGLLEKLNDVDYGYGQITHDTGNKWVDRGIGLAGDIILDPLTYVGGAATKTAKFTGGKAGRQSLALKLQRSGAAPDVVDSAVKYGPAFLDDAAREIGGIGPAGVYFGLGAQGKKLPGTAKLGRGLEKGMAKARNATGGAYGRKVADGKAAKLRVTPELERANRIIMKGEAVDGVTPGEALETIAFNNDKLAGEKLFADSHGRANQGFLNSITDNDAVGVTHALETGGQGALPAGARRIFKTIRDELVADGSKVGNLGENYVPHVWRQEYRKFLREDPRGQAIAKHLGIDPNSDPGLLLSRELRGGDVIDMPGGKTFTIPESGTIKDINEALARQFPDAPKALEDDIRQIISHYTADAGRAKGLRQAWSKLTASGSDIVQRLKNVSVEELDELASLTEAGTLKTLLEKQIQLKIAASAHQAVDAADIATKLRGSIVDHLEGTVKALGRDHADLKTELGAIGKSVRDGKATEKTIARDFAAVEKKVHKQFNDTVKQLDETERELATLRADQQLTAELRSNDARAIGSGSSTDGMGTRPGGPVLEGPLAPPTQADTVVQQKIAKAEKLQAELDDQLEMAVDAMERVDTLREEFAFANYQMASWDRVVDSPQLLADEAAERAAVVETAKIEHWVPEGQDSQWSERLDAAIKDVDKETGKLTPQGQARVDEVERQARAAHRSGVIVRQQESIIEEIKEELVPLQAELLAAKQVVRGHGAEHVPLSVRSRRAAAQKRAGAQSEEIADLRKAEQAAERRQDRMRSRARTAREEGVTKEARAEADADLLLRQEAHNNLADDWYEHTADLNNPKSTTTAQERLQRQQLLEARTAGLNADDQVAVLAARREDMATMQMDYETDMLRLADDEIGSDGLATAGAEAASRARIEARALWRETQEQIADIDKQIKDLGVGGPEGVAAREAMTALENRVAALHTRIGAAAQKRRWHERLAELEDALPAVDADGLAGPFGKGPDGRTIHGPVQGPAVPAKPKNPIHESTRVGGMRSVATNPVETIKAQRELVLRIERAQSQSRRIDEALTEFAEVRNVPEYGTLSELHVRMSNLNHRLLQLPDVSYDGNIPMRLADQDVKYGGKAISDVEAEIVADTLSDMASAVRQANSEWKKAKYLHEKEFPTANQGAAKPAGAQPPMQVTESGVQMPNAQAITREDYNAQVANGAHPTVGGKRSGAGQRGMQNAPGNRTDIEDELFVEKGFAGASDEAAALGDTGTDLTDEAFEAFDPAARGDGRAGGEFEEQALALEAVTPAMEAAREASKQNVLDLRANALETRKAYDRSLRAYGVRGDVTDGFAYNKWGNILLVDTDPFKPNTSNWAARNTEKAISMTDTELEAEVFKQTGKRKGDFKGPRPHKQMAAEIGAKAQLFSPGTKRYDKLPAGMADMAGRSNARHQIKYNMNPAGRRAVLSQARSKDRMAVDRVLNEKHLIERELKAVTAQKDEVLAVAREAQYLADEAKDRVAALSDDLRRTESISEGTMGLQARTRNAQAQAEEAKRQEGVARVTASGRDQAQQQEIAVKQAEKARVEEHVEALAAIEKQAGKAAAEEVNAVSTERALLGARSERISKVLETSKARQEHVKNLKKKVPAKLRKGATGEQVKRHFEELEAVMKEAADEGTPVATTTARLLESATQARLALTEPDVAHLQSQIDQLDEAAKKIQDAGLSEQEKLAAIAASPMAPVLKQVHEGFATIESQAFPEGADLATKQAVSDILNNVTVAMTKEPGELLRYYQEANRFFKTYATASPGFHVRNGMSAAFMNLTEGVSFKQTRRGMRDWRAYVQAGRAEAGGDLGAMKRHLDGLSPEDRTALEAVLGSGGGSGQWGTAELGDSTSKLVNNKFTNASHHIGADFVEGPARLALAKKYIDRGGDVQDAMGAIRRIHFDYTQLSDFDRTMKNIIPFWTFMSRNLPLQFEQMVTRPKAYSRYNSVMRNLNDGEEGEGMPEWLKKTGAVTVARNVPFFGGRDAVFAPDLPHVRMEDELNAMFPNPAGLASSVSPFLRVPVELAQNHSAFTGRALFDEGEDTALNQLKYIAENVVPPVGVAQRVTGMGRNEGKALEKQMNYAGLPFKSVSDEQRKFALERAAG